MRYFSRTLFDMQQSSDSSARVENMDRNERRDPPSLQKPAPVKPATPPSGLWMINIVLGFAVALAFTGVLLTILRKRRRRQALKESAEKDGIQSSRISQCLSPTTEGIASIYSLLDHEKTMSASASSQPTPEPTRSTVQFLLNALDISRCRSSTTVGIRASSICSPTSDSTIPYF